MIEESIYRTTIGAMGTLVSFELSSIDTIASIAVAGATLVYMILSIIKIAKELKK
jgi:hypothetical protein